ncbi:hypothetical protein TNCV_1918241 [Trichonephila clavipes]|nr:hypothetical protein TNCV_1918241 [Trichonephila clavipes]
MVSYNSKVFPEYVRPKFVGSPYDGKTFPFCGGIILFGFCQSSRSVCYNFSRHYSEFVLGQLRYRTRLHQYGFLVEALSSYILNTGSEVSAFLRLLNASTSFRTPRNSTPLFSNDCKGSAR